jgi:hypothetical protein
MAKDKKGALAKDPGKKTQTSFDPVRAQRRVDFLIKNRPNDPEIKRLQTKIKKNAPAGSIPATPQEITEGGFRGAGQAYENMLGRFQGADPYQMGQMYQGAFGQEMDRYRQNMMDQFNRQNQEEFQRQDVATQQQIAERGLDPSSPAAQALMKANTQRQDLARQEAMSAAEQGAYGVQEQAFGQAYKTAMSPYEQWGILQQPYMAGIQAQYQGQQLSQQQQFEAQQNELTRRAQMRIAGMNRGGGGGAPQLTPYERMEIESLSTGYPGAQPNPVAQGVQSFAGGAGQAITSNLKR